MDVPEVLNLVDVLDDLKGKKILCIETTRISNPSGGLILGIDVTFRSGEEDEEELSAVAKLLPPYRQSSHSFTSFRNELLFYRELLPTLQNFLREENFKKDLDFFPKFLGGRLSLDPTSAAVDENAVVLLENLRTLNFFFVDRIAGFDLETSRLILAEMAQFHAATLAVKMKRPDVFREKFVFEEYEEDAASDGLFGDVLEALARDDLCSLYLLRAKDLLDQCFENSRLPKNSPKFSQSDFAALVHGGLSVGSVMVQTYMNKTVAVKILDWKSYEHASVVRDVLFFVFTSVQDLLDFDALLQFYHKNLIANLEKLDCETEKFSMGFFEREMKDVASQFSYLHILAAITEIFVPLSHANLANGTVLNHNQLSDVCKRRICQITKIFIQKKWL